MCESVSSARLSLLVYALAARGLPEIGREPQIWRNLGQCCGEISVDLGDFSAATAAWRAGVGEMFAGFDVDSADASPPGRSALYGGGFSAVGWARTVRFSAAAGPLALDAAPRCRLLLRRWGPARLLPRGRFERARSSCSAAHAATVPDCCNSLKGNDLTDLWTDDKAFSLLTELTDAV